MTTPASQRDIPSGLRLADGFAARLERVTQSLAGDGFGAVRAVVLGSGLGGVVDAVKVERTLAFEEIEGFHAPTVVAHAGRLLQARDRRGSILILQGRPHAYEGLPMAEVLFPAAVLWALGARRILLTNAAGGLRPGIAVGDFLLLSDLLDLHPGDLLRGVVLPAGGSTVALLSRALAGRPSFDPGLRSQIQARLSAEGHALAGGVYVSVYGPNYETRAEIGMLRGMGADAVGMSTAPECMFLSRMGVAVAGLSCITNVAVETDAVPVTHDEVVQVGAVREAAMSEVVLLALEAMET